MLVLVSIIKNEGPYILEWIAYHRAIGVDHFILLDNESTDGTYFILRPLADAGIITYFRWETRVKYRFFEAHDIGPQVPAYDFAMRVIRRIDRWKWVGFIDLDEYIALSTGDNICDALAAFDKYGGVGLNWRIFGSAGHLSAPEGLVIENFTKRAPDDFHANVHVKTIAHIAGLRHPGIHIPNVIVGDIVDTRERVIQKEKDGLHDQAVFENLWINHYFTKSHEEWIRKRERGRATKHGSDPEKLRAESMFLEYDRNEIADTSMLERLPRVRQELTDLLAVVRSVSCRPWFPFYTGTA